jgi:CBS domain containing-hemolysin-like protein
MSAGDVWLLVLAGLLVVLAAVVSMSDAALARVSRVRAEELVREQRRGAQRLQDVITEVPATLNVLLLLRTLCELLATTLVAVVSMRRLDSSWQAILLAGGVMTVIDYVVVGVGARTLGRQHPVTVALRTARLAQALTRNLGPLPR